MSRLAAAPRRGLSLPEADVIAGLLADVMGPPPAGPASGVAPRPAAGRQADVPTAEFWGRVNWANAAEFAAPPPAAGPSRPPAHRLADVPAGRFLAAVNWANDPARAADELPPADGPPAADPWAHGRYLARFAWD